MPMLLPHRRYAADRALSWLLRLLLAGCLCAPLAGTVYVVTIYRDISSVGWSYRCLGDACVWLGDGTAELTWPPTQPCWHGLGYGYGYGRPC